MVQKQKTRKPRHRTYARNRAATAIRRKAEESDGTYFLKLVIVILLGTLWLRFEEPLVWEHIALQAFPLGGIIGLAGISLLEKNQTDRKIWYAVLIVVVIVCSFSPTGIII